MRLLGVLGGDGDLGSGLGSFSLAKLVGSRSRSLSSVRLDLLLLLACSPIQLLELNGLLRYFFDLVPRQPVSYNLERRRNLFDSLFS